jgi:hypothetical protein
MMLQQVESFAKGIASAKRPSHGGGKLALLSNLCSIKHGFFFPGEHNPTVGVA